MMLSAMPFKIAGEDRAREEVGDDAETARFHLRYTARPVRKAERDRQVQVAPCVTGRERCQCRGNNRASGSVGIDDQLS